MGSTAGSAASLSEGLLYGSALPLAKALEWGGAVVLVTSATAAEWSLAAGPLQLGGALAGVVLNAVNPEDVGMNGRGGAA